MARIQAPKARIDGPFAMDVVFWTPSGNARSDIDNAVGAVLDAIQDITDTVCGKQWVADEGLISNDRNCKGVSVSFDKSPKKRGMAPAYVIEVFLMDADEHRQALDGLRFGWRG